MKKGIAAVFTCTIILVAFGACLSTVGQPSPISAKIGIFYYAWYNPDWPISWDTTKIVDTPVLGYYNSCDPATIRQHLIWIQDLGIDFVVISWWGFYDDYGKFTDNAAKQAFETAANISSTLKIAIMVEPFNKTGSSYDFNGICDHIYENFVALYPFLYYYNGNKPMICFFNNQSLTDNGTIPLNDERFNAIIVGQQSYADWIYTDLNPYEYRALGQNQTSVTPRYDESHIPDRTGNATVDVYLNESVYNKEWMDATQLFRNQRITTILISTWNEFPERTAIEPHNDSTAVNQDPYFLYNITRDYVTQIRQQNPSPSPTIPEYNHSLAATAAILTTISISAVSKRIRKNKSKTEKF